MLFFEISDFWPYTAYRLINHMKSKVKRIESPRTTGAPPGLLQDDCRKLHKWFASRLDARVLIRRWFGKQCESPYDHAK